MGLLATYLFVYLLYNICKPSFREKYIYLQIECFYQLPLEDYLLYFLFVDEYIVYT